MKIALVGHGTRGDVQPYVALGWELQKRGHEALLIAPRNMTEFVSAAGLEFRASNVDVQSQLSAPAAQKMLREGRFLAFVRWLQAEDARNRRPLHDSWVEALSDVDLIVGHPLAEDALAAIGARFQTPVLPFYLYPILPTRHTPPVFLGGQSFGLFNASLHRIFREVARRAALPAAQALRARLGVSPTHELFVEQIERRKLPIVLSYSSALAPQPPDYPTAARFGPPISLPDDLKLALGEAGLSAELEAFLRDGEPPIYFGMGSMPIDEPLGTIAVVRQALEALGMRGIVSAGWSDLRTIPSDSRLFVTGTVDHAALLPRCALAVHHGGAGTTLASARAGIPTLVTSVFADQPDWGRRLEALGVGQTFPFRKLTVPRLRRACEALLVEPIRARASRLGRTIGAEGGVSQVADLVLAAAQRTDVPW